MHTKDASIELNVSSKGYNGSIVPKRVLNFSNIVKVGNIQETKNKKN
jgi:hypothetical protein